MTSQRSSCFLLLALVTACAVPTVNPDGGSPVPTPDAAVEAGIFSFGDANADVTAPPDGGTCEPPDMLIVLDRSDSMVTEVGTSGTRIDLAIGAIDYITAPPTDTSVRFGLEVLPQIGGATCSTELVVPMNLSTGKTIANALAAASPQTDYGTPIGVALASAETTLATQKISGRAQSVLLITDGGECCSCGTNDQDIATVQKLESEGIDTFVVGFGGDDDPVLLNDLACAGHTASNFATACTCTQAGCTASASINATTTQLYYKASDGAALKSALVTITNQTCCGCNVPN